MIMILYDAIITRCDACAVSDCLNNVYRFFELYYDYSNEGVIRGYLSAVCANRTAKAWHADQDETHAHIHCV